MARKIELNQDYDLKSIVSLFPAKLQKKSMTILKKLKINANGNIIYPDGSEGSHVGDLLRWYMKIEKHKRPVDGPRFNRLLTINKVKKPVLNKKTSTTKRRWNK